MATDWICLEARIPASDEDAVTESLMALGLPGWAIEGQGELLTLSIHVLPEDADEMTTAVERLAEVPVTRRSFSDQSWTEGWAPERAGPFVVASLGAPEPELSPGEYLVWLAPALAFGGGEHPTTRLCLEALPELAVSGLRCLDVGCGSGVLSVALGLLGAASVQATDVDPTALRATRRAAEASGTAVDVVATGLASMAEADLAVANILAPVLVALAPDIAGKVRPGGRILLSGIREGRESEVAAAYPECTLEWTRRQGGWVALLLQKRAQASS